ncbi:putative LacI-family transcriptional regulator [Actinoplanes missouriensis 431]|uniref:Putative LacI-family transcriptional regulator n=2 Tax=Actinoplanes missouriensis TaxID=1866 RepID=I0GZ49_ACTM4|nr:putative LacI-family transcriptional regulator [Actinoplanes missouriensis 431]
MHSKAKATIRDVAAHAGVSRAAVSKVLRRAPGVSAEMHRRVTAAISELQYRPQVAARSLRGRSQTLGVLSPQEAGPLATSIITSFARALDATPYDFLVRPVPDTADHQLEAAWSLVDHGMEGLVLADISLTEDQLESLARRVPVVLVGRASRSDLLDSFSVDDVAAARLQLDHLVALGHTRIAWLSPAVSGDRHPAALLERVCAGSAVFAHPAGLGDDGGYRAACELLAQPQPPTAIVTCTDVMALGVLRAARDVGVDVPGQLSVVGAGDSSIAAHPLIALSSVSAHDASNADDVLGALLDRVAGRTTAIHVQWRPRMVARRSSAPPLSR